MHALLFINASAETNDHSGQVLVAQLKARGIPTTYCSSASDRRAGCGPALRRTTTEVAPSCYEPRSRFNTRQAVGNPKLGTSAYAGGWDHVLSQHRRK